MLRRFLDRQLAFFEKGKPLFPFRPLVSALDAFAYEVPLVTKRRPFIRDAVDLKRWMFLVILALLPVIMMAIWNTGVQKFVYSSKDYSLMEQFISESKTFQGYFNFVTTNHRYWSILKLGLFAFLPVMIISYLVGGLCEAFFACVRGHEIAEGFLVTGMLYPLILPPTIPYWMVAFGVAVGVILVKEVFGGTGMNILNPALACRAFLFFTFPGKMTGDVWVGTNPTATAVSVAQMNAAAGLNEMDGFTQASPLGQLNAAIPEIKRIHVDAIASNVVGNKVSTFDTLQRHLENWNALSGTPKAELGHLTADQMQSFVTSSLDQGGLGLLPGNYLAAHQFTETAYGLDRYTDGNLFWGNIIGSMGETSTFACLLGALFLIITGIGSWRTMLGMGLVAFLTAFTFEFFSKHIGMDQGAWNPAKYALPAYKHLIMGGFAFGLVFMATDPVSSPGLNLSRWIYGGLIGFLTILIRLINPAYPEGVMLAILFGNVFAPLIDFFALRSLRNKKRVRIPSYAS